MKITLKEKLIVDGRKSHLNAQAATVWVISGLKVNHRQIRHIQCGFREDVSKLKQCCQNNLKSRKPHDRLNLKVVPSSLTPSQTPQPLFFAPLPATVATMTVREKTVPVVEKVQSDKKRIWISCSLWCGAVWLGRHGGGRKTALRTWKSYDAAAEKQSLGHERVKGRVRLRASLKTIAFNLFSVLFPGECWRSSGPACDGGLVAGLLSCIVVKRCAVVVVF